MEFLKSRAFPSFYKEYAPKLLEFFGSWVDWLNKEENAAYIIDHLSTENDIDESIEAYKTHLRNELIVDFPEEVSSDLKLLLKNIFYLYNSKSSIESYEFLFRCLFNSSAEISYPKYNILRLSDGRWYTPYYLKTKGSFSNDVIIDFKSYESLMIKGETSNAYGYLKKTEVYSFDNGTTFSNTLSLDYVSGVFISDEHLLLIDPKTGKIQDDLDLYVDTFAIGEGKWNGTYGFLDSDMYIQDSYYYQDFSYIIKSIVPSSKWRTLVKKLLHPAGLGLFAHLETGGTDEDPDLIPVIKELNPLDFLKFWHIFFKMYIFETPVSIALANWTYKSSEATYSGIQSHSETPDYWLFEGNYFSREGINDIKVKDFNNCFNRSSVLLFKHDGTLINPDIIRWNDFTLTDDIETKFTWGVTLHPDNHLICGNFTGTEWKPYDKESNIKKNFMVFVTSTNDTSNKRVKSFTLDRTYENFTDTDPTIENSTLDSVVMTPIEKHSVWRDLALEDFVTINKKKVQILDANSFIKIPNERVIFDTKAQTYVFLETYYEDEKIAIYNYSDADLDEYIYIKDPSIKEVTLKKATTKEYVVAFIDGKFSSDFDVEKNKIYIRVSTFMTVEFYVLSRIEASRKTFQEYANDKKFTYNNARILPYMYYNTHLDSLDIINYHEIPYTMKHAFATIYWINYLDYTINFEKMESLRRWITSEAQNTSHNLDNIIWYGYQNENETWYDTVSDIIPISNQVSSLVFSHDGRYIDPDNIDWHTWKLLDKSHYNTVLYSLQVRAEKPLCKFTLSNETSYAYANYNTKFEDLTSNSIVYNSVNDALPLEELKESDIVIVNGTTKAFSTVLSTTKVKCEVNVNANSLDTIAEYNFFAFVDGKKILDSKVSMNDTSYVFTEAITGNVILTNYNKNYVKAYYTGKAKSLTIKENTRNEFIIVFVDGYLYNDYTYANNTITLKKTPTENYEVYITNSYDYFRKSKSSCDLNGYFAFTNVRRLNYMPSNYLLTMLRELECITQLKQLEDNIQINRSLELNALNYLKFSLNLDEQCVIPAYNTIDNVLYFGEQIQFDKIDDRIVEEYQIRTNRECTLIFDDKGYLIDPETIRWAITEFKQRPDTSRITIVILNPSHISSNSIVTKMSYTPIELGETTVHTVLYEDVITYKNLGEYSNNNGIMNVLDSTYLKELTIKDLVDEYDATQLVGDMTFVPLDGEFIPEHELIFIDNKKIYPTYYTKTENSYVFSLEKLSEQKNIYNIDVFEYNPDDIETIIQEESYSSRFITLPRGGVIKQNLLVFRSGLQTSDYYISGNTLCFNTNVKNETIEVYLFRPYDYLFVTESPYNKNYDAFIPKNIKRISLYGASVAQTVIQTEDTLE